MDHLDESIEDWTREIAMDEGNPVYWMERGLRKSEKGDLAGAEEDLNRAIELNPDDAGNYLALAKVYFYNRLDRYMDDALDALDRAVELDPTRPDIRTMRGDLLWSVFGDAENAQKEFDIAIENIDPNNPGPYNMRGLFYLQSGQFELCVEDYTNYIKLEPNNPYGSLERGDCYAELGKDDLARDDYETFLMMTDGRT